jgi:hypothetical protein
MSERDKQGLAGTTDADASSEGLAGTGTEISKGRRNRDASASGLAGPAGTRADTDGIDRSDVPGGLAGGMDSADVTDSGELADASQEGANIQP